MKKWNKLKLLLKKFIKKIKNFFLIKILDCIFEIEEEIEKIKRMNLINFLNSFSTLVYWIILFIIFIIHFFNLKYLLYNNERMEWLKKDFKRYFLLIPEILLLFFPINHILIIS